MTEYRGPLEACNQNILSYSFLTTCTCSRFALVGLKLNCFGQQRYYLICTVQYWLICALVLMTALSYGLNKHAYPLVNEKWQESSTNKWKEITVRGTLKE